jgi:hypothetical protein
VNALRLFSCSSLGAGAPIETLVPFRRPRHTDSARYPAAPLDSQSCGDDDDDGIIIASPESSSLGSCTSFVVTKGRDDAATCRRRCFCFRSQCAARWHSGQEQERLYLPLPAIHTHGRAAGNNGTKGTRDASRKERPAFPEHCPDSKEPDRAHSHPAASSSALVL